ncbi:hypothetical protein RY831_21695, partial [Noviherbaspirillum sp. CPCC 100848]
RATAARATAIALRLNVWNALFMLESPSMLFEIFSSAAAGPPVLQVSTRDEWIIYVRCMMLKEIFLAYFASSFRAKPCPSFFSVTACNRHLPQLHIQHDEDCFRLRVQESNINGAVPSILV